MKQTDLLYRSTVRSLFTIFSYPGLVRRALACFGAVFNCFFMLQLKGVLFRRKYRVSSVDHPLDGEIPFKTSWVDIYMDFSPFWVRTQGFVLRKYGKAAVPYVRDFLAKISDLYHRAAAVARVNFSTTNRPHYYGTFKFKLIHLFDPHLMCIPSLHVMVVVYTFIKFREEITALNGLECYQKEVDWTRKHALAITESILYVKQHSVNCIPAALYTMTRFDASRFSPEVIDMFIGDLFQKSDGISPETVKKIKTHAAILYKDFLSKGMQASSWEDPLFDFLRAGENCG
ncbi:MAG: hypothetical protein LBD22_03550 [Spirochaetaceae bacterium]|nr:hypothetical protein [Spirochaetaceae bacterium]